MKKLLLSLAAVALTGAFAMAESYTLQFKGNGLSNDSFGQLSENSKSDLYMSAGTEYVSGIADASKVVLGKEEEGLKFSTQSANGSLTLTLSAAGQVNATSIVVTAKKWKSEEEAAVSINGTDAQSLTDESADYTFAVTGNLTQIKIDATKRLYVNKITVNYTAGAVTPQPAGLSFSKVACTAALGMEFTAPELTKATDAAVTYTSSNPEVATVDAATGAVTLVAVGSTVIKATTPATANYEAGEAQYSLTVIAAYSSIADFFAAGSDVSGIINFPMTVAYQNGSSTYAFDAAGDFTLIFGSAVGTRQRGDIIPAGWEGRYWSDESTGIPEIYADSAPEASTETADFTPAEVESVNNEMVNHVVVLKKVTFAADTPAGSSKFKGITDDQTEYEFYNKFKLESAVAGIYNVELVVSKSYNGLQLYPIQYTEWTESGVDDITVADGEAQYFNMQGVRVANPENGMFIRIQNGKAQKVVIK